jgi:hypothetical protein
LFPNVYKLGYNYPITEIDTDAKTIKVTGNVTTYLYPPTTFAAIYGQFIKDAIDVSDTSKQVKFFDRKGANSYADGDTTYNGVCEVCHTQTMYHKNDGTGNYHYPGARCYVCHAHINGFGYAHGEPGKDCEDCHGHDDGWNGGDYYGTTQSHSTHTESDSDDLKGPYIECDVCHDTDNYPYFKSGTDSNGDGKYNLSETDVCNNCHSPNGAFDGVNNPTFGAKANWTGGVYASPTLKTGKEKWCAGCHDDVPAYSKQTPIEIIVDNTDANFSIGGTGWSTATSTQQYGTNLRYHVAGTGINTATWTPNIPEAGDYSVYAWWVNYTNRATNAPYTISYNSGSETVRVNQQEMGGTWNYLGTYTFATGTSGSVVLSDDADGQVIADAIKWESGIQATYAPNVIGDNTTYGFYVTGHKINCLNCHDADKKHIDGEHRTYEADESTYHAINPYCDSYRLKNIDGQPCMIIPRPGRVGVNLLNNWHDFALCFTCHNKYKVLGETSAPDATNFWNNDSSPANSHYLHLGIGGYHFDSDWDTGHGASIERNDSLETCITCHNVHGSPTKAMIRHGELISSYGSTDKVPSLNFAYLLPNPDPDAAATWTPNIPETNTYKLYGWWRAHANWATNAKLTIHYNGGSQTIEINQEQNGSQWNFLGSFTFAAGTTGYVELTNESADDYIVADAFGWDIDGTFANDWDGDGVNDPDIVVNDHDAGCIRTGGNWVERTGITESYNDDHYYHEKPAGIPDSTATLEQSIGGIFNYDWSFTTTNGVCRACHSAVSYFRTPTYIGPRVVMQKAEPSSIANNGLDQVLLTAYVYSPGNDNISSVTVDLTPIDGSSTQAMYDDGTNGDAVAGDKIYSYRTTVPGTVVKGLKRLTVTGTDSQSRTGSEDIELMVANPGWTIVDNKDADYTGYWTVAYNSVDKYGDNLKFINAGIGNNKAMFSPVLSSAGNYNVYAWWSQYTNRATNAPYTINYSGGSDTVRVNQQVNGGQFMFLGTYYFDAQTEPATVIVDNEDAVFNGDWAIATHDPIQYGESERFLDAGTGDNTATFIPDLPQPGNYEVYAWWTPYYNRATNAPYTINYSGGSDTVRVNQEQAGGGWTYLGTYYFDTGTGGSVVISDDANEYVIADAIKWQLAVAKQSVVLSDDANGQVIADAILFEPAD